MKSTKIILPILVSVAMSLNVDAQTWGTSSTETWTTFPVGIGSGTAPMDAQLHIYNSVGTTCPSGGIVGILPNNPALKIDDIATSEAGTFSHNSFELWNNSYDCGSLTTSSNLQFFVQSNYTVGANPYVQVGINKATATSTLDVGGSINADNNLAVGKNGSIGNNLTVSMNGTIGNNLTVNGGEVYINPLGGTTYAEKLQINGNVGFLPSIGGGAVMRSIRAETDNYLEMYSKHDASGGASFFLHSNGSMYPSLAGSAQIWSSAAVGENMGFGVSSTWGNVLQVNTDGNTTINGEDQNGTYLNINHINGTASFIRANGAATGSGLNLLAGSHGSPGADGAFISLFTNGSSVDGDIFIETSGTTNSNGVFFFNPNSNLTMLVRNDNKVVIGNEIAWNATQPGDYNLYVSHGILTEKLKVANSTDIDNWSDFVFDKKYNLMPLNKVEDFVKQNRHLPEIPSASEVAKDGIDVASMDAKLLQKIEELTLYVIQQQKEINELKSQHNKQ